MELCGHMRRLASTVKTVMGLAERRMAPDGCLRRGGIAMVGACIFLISHGCGPVEGTVSSDAAAEPSVLIHLTLDSLAPEESGAPLGTILAPVTAYVPRGDAIRGFVAAGGTFLVGRDVNGSLEAYNSATGARRWTWQAPNWIHNAPQVSDSTVVVTWGDNRVVGGPDSLRRTLGSGPGGVAALRLHDGALLWKRDVNGAVMTSALVSGDTVFVITGTRRLLVLRVGTGAVLRDDSLPGVPAMANPRRFGSRAIIGLSDPPAILALDGSFATRLWYRPLPPIEAGPSDVQPAVRGDLVVTTGTDFLFGHKLFVRDVLPRLIDRVAMRLRLRPYDAFARQYVALLQLSTGRVLWLRSFGVGHHVEQNRSGTPVLTANRILLQSPVLSEVLAIDLAGRVVWRRSLANVAKGTVALLGDRVLAAQSNGELVLFAIKDGREIQRWASAGRIAFFSPTIFMDRIVYALDDGRLATIDRKTITP
jgi:outer membrane protein assembly factor BamB